MRDMKYIYIVNRFKLGDKCDEIIRKLQRASKAFHRTYEIDIHDTIEDAKAAAARYKDMECVITAIGGDGSINLLLNELVGTKNILAYIPFGTGNDFFRANMETLEDGIYDVDIVRINDRYCINAACFGIDAEIANDEKFIHNRFIPQSMRFNAAVVYHFLTYRKGRHLKIVCEGEIVEKDYTTVVAANSQYYGGGYHISPGSKIDDGVMEVYLVDQLRKIQMARIILSMKNAGHLHHPALKMIRTGKLIITSDQPFAANIDGEPLLSDRFELELVPKGIRMEFNKAFIDQVRI